jgi:uncharacterized protein
MLAVLAVNAAGYLVAPWGAVLGERTPADSGTASAVQGLIAALLQGKGYPMLAFLFGMGLWFAMRGRDAVAGRARAVTRQKKLLGLGVVHGVFVYFGDILTLYALIGWTLLSRVHEPWGPFRRRLRRALWWAVGVTLLAIAITFTFSAIPGPAGDGADAAEQPLVQAQRWLDFMAFNGLSYGVLLASSLIFGWPVLRFAMLCGMAAARLRLLTHRRWRAALERWVVRWALPILVLNLGYGLAYVSLSAGTERAYWIEAFGNLVGPPLAAIYVFVLALSAQGGRAAWCRRLAPLGQRTLTLYVGHGVLCVLLFGGVGLGLELSTLDMALFSLVLWALALGLAHASGHRRWPLEAWLARR